MFFTEEPVKSEVSEEDPFFLFQKHNPQTKTVSEWTGIPALHHKGSCTAKQTCVFTRFMRQMRKMEKGEMEEEEQKLQRTSSAAWYARW